MSKNRMEAFSDGVLAIIITVMVLNFSVPHDADFKRCMAGSQSWPPHLAETSSGSSEKR